MCLGVLLDSRLTFVPHIRRISGRCFYHLRQLRVVRKSLTIEAARTMVHSFVVARCDYCNSVYYGASAVHIRPLQNVLNAAARLFVRKGKYDSITTDLPDVLHWLPAQQRTEYKVSLLICKCLHQAAPLYLTEMCLPVSAIQRRHGLRSAVREDLEVPRCNLARYGQRSFYVSGPSLWNSQPLTVRDSSLTLTQFCTRLKTFLFTRAYGT